MAMLNHPSPAPDAAQRGNKGATIAELRNPDREAQDRGLVCLTTADGSTMPNLKVLLRFPEVLVSARHADVDVFLAQRTAPTPRELAAGRLDIGRALLDTMPTAKHPAVRA